MSSTRNFNILDPQVNIWKSRLIEASAGTGKTFAMENLFLRYLEESQEPLEIEEMLAITFTKASTRELKERIYQRLEKSATSIHSKRAKLAFDRANIFTIHGFALRVLTEFSLYTDAAFTDQEYEQDFTLLKIQALKEALASPELAENFCPEQLTLMASEVFARGDDSLDSSIAHLSVLSNYQTIETFPEAWQAFKKLMEQRCYLDIHKICQHAAEFISFFKGKLVLEDLYEFCQIEITPNYFRTLLTRPWVLESLVEENLNKTKRKKFEAAGFSFAYPLMELAQNLAAITRRAKEKKRLLLALVALAKTKYEVLLEKSGLIDPDLLLKKLALACDNPSFVRAVQRRYKIAIIDEFQDTDPLQWQIFETLFCGSASTHVHLVGDPKQSIYSFRGADVYTYLAACQKMGADNVESLGCNYRSTKPLLDALNAFFCRAERGFLLLPTLQTVLPYQAVESKCQASGDTPFHLLWMRDITKDEAIPVALMPFFAEKVLAEVRAGKRIFKDFAILVSTHKEAQLIYQECKRYNIPSTLKKGQPLFYSRSYQTLQALIILLAEKGSLALFRYLLLTPLLCLEVNEHVTKLWQELVLLQEKKGFVAAMVTFLQLPWNGHSSIRDQLVANQEFAELGIIEDLVFIIAASYNEAGQKLDVLLKLLEKKEKEEKASTENAVQILTAHVSKGLEFPVVFVFSAYMPERKKSPAWIKQGDLVQMPHDNPAVWQLYQEEQKAEKLRQLYVALTRAKEELYIAHLPQGENSIFELFLARCHEVSDASYTEEWAQGLLQQLARDKVLHIHMLSKSTLADSYRPEKLAIEQKKLCSYQTHSIKKSSFSTLAKVHERQESLRESIPDLKNSYTLPKGTVTGSLVHQVLEELFLKKLQRPYQKQTIAALIAKKVIGTTLQTWQDQIELLIEDGLSMPLPGLGCSLQELDPEKIHVELEFLHPLQKLDLMHGIIDLVFEHRGKFYLLDWKTNHLGYDETGYEESLLLQEMQARDYFLQAKIYTEAFKRYLAQFSNVPFKDLFGGMYYVFLRGKKALHIKHESLI